MQKLVCKNMATGRIMTFDYGEVVFLEKVEGIGGAEYENTTSTATGEDGETVEGESQSARHSVITAFVLSDYDTIKDQVDAVFQKGIDGQMSVYRDDGTIRTATYRPESWELPQEGIIRTLTINLLHPDPLFYDPEEDYTAMASWRALATFPFTFHSPFRVSEFISNLLASITNTSSTDQALRIVFTATGEVHNPFLIDVKRQETLKVQTVMHNGDRITITTAPTDMHIMQQSGGAETEITNLAVWPIAWLQLHPGENLYRYGADSGLASLTVQIWHRQSYSGGV